MPWKRLKARQASAAQTKLKFEIAGKLPSALFIAANLEYNRTLSLAALACYKDGPIMLVRYSG
jgi:hypothetical protein